MARRSRRERQTARNLILLGVAFLLVRQVGCEAGAPDAPPQAMLPPWPPATAQEDGPTLADDLTHTNVYVVLDASGSMREAGCSEGRPKIDAAKEALVAFASALGPEVQLGLLAFDGLGVRERMALGPVDGAAFQAALEKIQPAARTPLRTAIERAYDALLVQGSRQLGYGEYHLVVVTDGLASDGEDPSEIVGKVLAESPLVVHTIGFCIDDDHSLNQPGRTLYRTARSQDELRAGLSAVLAEAPDFSATEFQ
ncbi:MAG: VWA domain-containing protein [Myxococcota bacterium]|nr:VWA domain-containing protein [Myxococcota bacterium]